MASLAAVFAVIFVVLNLMLDRFIVQPILRISSVAEAISTGEADVPEFDAEGQGEIAGLERAFNRMRRSLTLAMRGLQR